MHAALITAPFRDCGTHEALSYQCISLKLLMHAALMSVLVCDYGIYAALSY
jgi:hypothetical protein